MCLLVVVLRPLADVPLVVGANRDERLDRPAQAMTVLSGRSPRILGGRDLLAGGTWLAVNEHGVVAGLTNAPAAGGRDDTKRSRGELPLLAAGAPSAAEAAAVVADRVDPARYNPAWMLVGDRRSLFALRVDGERVGVEPLGPGVHVLENRPPGQRSAKVDHVRALLGALGGDGGPPGADAGSQALLDRLASVLRDHSIPPGMAAEGPIAGRVRPPELGAACVHTAGYGTRSAALVALRADAGAPPRVLVADGPPCANPFVDATWRWEAAADGT